MISQRYWGGSTMWKYIRMGRKCSSIKLWTKIQPAKLNFGFPAATYLGIVEWPYDKNCRMGGYMVITDYIRMYKGYKKNTYHPKLYKETHCENCPFYIEDYYDDMF